MANSGGLGRRGLICGALALVLAVGCTTEKREGRQAAQPEVRPTTTTPIKHLVVIFGENISFDHYFGTYPNAENKPGEPPFTAAPGTPAPNNLVTPLDPTNGFTPVADVDLLGTNPNFTTTANGTDAANPIRLAPTEAATADMNHAYTSEQRAAHGGAMDLFPMHVGNYAPPPHSEPLKALG